MPPLSVVREFPEIELPGQVESPFRGEPDLDSGVGVEEAVAEEVGFQGCFLSHARGVGSERQKRDDK